MIVVTAQLWPHGSQADSRELFNATISNANADDVRGDSYFAKVCARPYEALSLPGYSSMVEVVEHHRRNGLAPLLMAVINAPPGQHDGIILPSARVLAHRWLHTTAEYEQLVRGG